MQMSINYRLYLASFMLEIVLIVSETPQKNLYMTNTFLRLPVRGLNINFFSEQEYSRSVKEDYLLISL